MTSARSRAGTRPARGWPDTSGRGRGRGSGSTGCRGRSSARSDGPRRGSAPRVWVTRAQRLASGSLPNGRAASFPALLRREPRARARRCLTWRIHASCGVLSRPRSSFLFSTCSTMVVHQGQGRLAERRPRASARRQAHLGPALSTRVDRSTVFSRSGLIASRALAAAASSPRAIAIMPRSASLARSLAVGSSLPSSLIPSTARSARRACPGIWRSPPARSPVLSARRRSARAER